MNAEWKPWFNNYTWIKDFELTNAQAPFIAVQLSNGVWRHANNHDTHWQELPNVSTLAEAQAVAEAIWRMS